MLTRPHRPPDETPSLPPSPSSPLLMLSNPRPDHPYARGCPPDTAYHPYARGVPSQHAPNTTYPYACVVPSQHAPDTAYHPYACGVHSQHAPNTAYHPYARSALPTCSQHHLSLCFQVTSIVYGGLLAYTITAIAKIC
ncbi:hypothetical protein O181_064978 [Austropuccinia psidii MF-1]|uniref:Uncharacterized protein n=1 Tax=Austropuccinia psidii MF-1 TaxID=1389203 RepID=A0A9Q3I250_9BASI|nr:hypothetical protein [Austropuccinia psidii MF-1]